MKISFIFKDRVKIATINGNCSGLINGIINLLPSFLDKEGCRQVSINGIITPELLENLNKMVEKYKVKEVCQLRSLFKDYPEGEAFFILPMEISSEESSNIQKYLLVKNDLDPKKSLDELNNFINQIKKHYRIIHQSGEKKVHIGESDKKKRVCRYCHRSIPDVSFKQVAHTISESLGNKTIITNTECDCCNNRYGIGIETDCANFHYFLRRFYNIKGKGPIKGGGTNFNIEYSSDGTINIGVVMNDDEIDEFERNEKKGSLSIPLHTSLGFKLQNVYRALCKYSLGILKDDEMSQFHSTIEWMDSKKIFSPLPKVAMMFPTNFRLSNPRISIFLRTSEEKTLPIAIGQVEFADIAYCFIIPVEEDSINYADKDLWERISLDFPMYKSSAGWKLIDFSSDNQQKGINVLLRFIQKGMGEK